VTYAYHPAAGALGRQPVGKGDAVAARLVLIVSAVVLLAAGGAASADDAIMTAYRAQDIEGLLKPVLQKAEALGRDGRVSDAARAILAAVPEDKRQPVHNFALGNVLYRTRPDLSRDLHRKAAEAVPDSAMAQLEFAMEEQRSGNCAAAVPAYRTVLAAQPELESVHALIAGCLVQLGDDKLAVAHWLKSRHERNHVMIEKQIHEVYGTTTPGQRRGEMLELFRGGQTDLAEAIVWLDLNFEQDWWNSKVERDFLDRDLKEFGAAFGADSRRFRELKLLADAATGQRKLEDGLKELGLLQPPSGAFPESSLVAYHLIRMALEQSLTNTEFLLKAYEAELRRRALSDDASDLKALQILGFLIHERRREQIGEIDQAGWKRYRMSSYAASALIELGNAGKLSLTSPELSEAVKAFPGSVDVQEIALREARKAGKTGKDLAPYITRLITAEYTELTGMPTGARNSYKLKQLFIELAKSP
jgi:hypothetical protein